MAWPLSKRWANGVLKPWTSTPAQHQTLSKRWRRLTVVSPDIGVLKPLHNINLSNLWKCLRVVSPKMPLVKFRRRCRNQPIDELIDHWQFLDHIELIKTALDTGDYY